MFVNISGRVTGALITVIYAVVVVLATSHFLRCARIHTPVIRVIGAEFPSSGFYVSDNMRIRGIRYTQFLEHSLENTVSWVRHRDIHLLTVGVETYTSDQRFVASHFPRTEDWTLQVKYPQRRDSGIYECQVSTTPPIGHSMHLSVVEPVTSIVGEPEMFINKDSTMNLTCVVRHSPEPPTAIYWTHDHEVINYDSPRGGVSVITEKGEVTTSYLLVQRAQRADSGQYTCHPSNANTKTILVHVLNGEHPAAMQHGGQLRLANLPFVMISTTLLAFLNHRY